MALLRRAVGLVFALPFLGFAGAHGPGGQVTVLPRQATTTAVAKTHTYVETFVWTSWQYPNGPNLFVDYTTWYSVTQTEPVPPTTYPATVVHTATTTARFVDRAVDGFGTQRRETARSRTSTFVSSTTWVLHAPKPTDMAAAARRIDALPCDDCPAPADFRQDPRCEALGLDTACQGQCESRDGGVWWCRWLNRIDINLRNNSEVMGRVCWGKTRQLHQLLEPCVASDHQRGCLPCLGRQNYTALDWV